MRLRNLPIVLATVTALLAVDRAWSNANDGVPDPVHSRPARAAATGEVVAIGMLEGRSGHTAGGIVRLLREGERWTVEFGDDFFLDGAPAPSVGFGDGAWRAETRFVELEKRRRLTGARRLTLPAALDPSGFTQLWLWCDRFDVPLGVAELRRAG
jgi:hypothetical protein